MKASMRSVVMIHWSGIGIAATIAGFAVVVGNSDRGEIVAVVTGFQGRLMLGSLGSAFYLALFAFGCKLGYLKWPGMITRVGFLGAGVGVPGTVLSLPLIKRGFR